MDASDKPSIAFTDKDLLRVLKLKTCSRGVSEEWPVTAETEQIVGINSSLKYCSGAMAAFASPPVMDTNQQKISEVSISKGGLLERGETQETMVVTECEGRCNCKHYCPSSRGLGMLQSNVSRAISEPSAGPAMSTDNESEGVKFASHCSLDFWQRQTADLTARLSESVAMNEELRRQMQQMSVAAVGSKGEGEPVGATTTATSRSKHLCYWRKLVQEISKQLVEAKVRENKLMGELEVERGYLGQTAGGGSMSGDELREIVGEGMTAEELLEKIQRTELLLTLTLRHAPIVITHSDLDLRYTFIYNAPPTWKPEDVIGKTDNELTGLVPGGSDIKTMKEAVLETGKTRRMEIKFDLPECGPVWYIVSCEPLRNKAGKTVGVINIMVDITEEAVSRERLAKLREEMAVRDVTEKELRRTIQLADEAIMAKNNFLAVMSHEIRTPLNGVLGMAQVLATTGLDEEQRELVDAMVFSGDVLLAIISDILDLSKLESTQLDLEERELRPKEVVKHVVSTAIAATRGRNIVIEGHVADNVPLSIIGDPLRIKQVITNLVFNAVKFTKRGHILVRVSALDSSGEAQRSNEEVSTPAPKAIDIFRKVESMTKAMMVNGEGEKGGMGEWGMPSGRSLATVKSEVLGLLEEGARLKGGLSLNSVNSNGESRVESKFVGENESTVEGSGKKGVGRKEDADGLACGIGKVLSRAEKNAVMRFKEEAGRQHLKSPQDFEMAVAESAGEGQGEEGGGEEEEFETNSKDSIVFDTTAIFAKPDQQKETLNLGCPDGVRTEGERTGEGEQGVEGEGNCKGGRRELATVERQGSATGKRLRRTESGDGRGTIKKAGRKRVKFDGGRLVGEGSGSLLISDLKEVEKENFQQREKERGKKYWEDDDMWWAWNQRGQEQDNEEEDEEATLRVDAAGGGDNTTSTEDGEYLWLQFEVEDTGIGIPKAAFPTLFEKFTQVHTSTTRNYGGTGLGLAICKQLVELMRGQILVRSKVGVGTTFTFTVRCRVPLINKETAEGCGGAGDAKLAKSNSNSLARFRKLQAGMSFMSPHPGAPLGMPTWEDEGKQSTEEGERQVREEREEGDESLLDHTEQQGHTGGSGGKDIIQISREGEKLEGKLSTYGKNGKGEKSVKGGKGELEQRALEGSKGGSGGPGEFAFQGVRNGVEAEDGRSLKMRSKELGNIGEKSGHLKEMRRKPRLLLAEDNKVNVMVALSMLKRLGLEADVAYHGMEAIQAIKSKQYDLVLMDICMPIMDGLEVTKRVRYFERTGVWNESEGPLLNFTDYNERKEQDSSTSSAQENLFLHSLPTQQLSEQTKLSGTNTSENCKNVEKRREERRHLPIVAMTANALADCESQCSGWMDGFITKPITFKKLSDALQVYLDHENH